MRKPTWSIRLWFEIGVAIFLSLVISFEIQKNVMGFRITDRYAVVKNDFNQLQNLTAVISLDLRLRDPWDNCYRHLGNKRWFSCGEDGRSVSEGEDLDDINSWSSHSKALYHGKTKAYVRKRILISSLTQTFPFVFIGVFGFLIIFRSGMEVVFDRRRRDVAAKEKRGQEPKI